MAMNDFQAAIDYLIADRNTAQQAKRQGLFTSNMAQTPTTAIAPKVVDELFGDEYKRRTGGSSSDTFDPFAGSPAQVGSNPFGPATADDVVGWSQREAAARANANAIAQGTGLLGGLMGAGPFGGLLAVGAKYGIPAFANYMGERSYDSFLADQDARAANVAAGLSLGGVGTYSDRNGNLGTVSKQALIDAYNREMFGAGANQESLDSDYYAQTYNTPDMMGPSPSYGSGYGTDSWSGGMDSYAGSSIDAGDRGE
jgi:hypothetical protein